MHFLSLNLLYQRGLCFDFLQKHIPSFMYYDGIVLWSEATKKGVKGESPLARYKMTTVFLESCLNNPSSRQTVKFNCDCECDDSIKFNYEGMDCCSERNVLDYMLAL